MEKYYWIDDVTELGIACPCCGKSFEDYIHVSEHVGLKEVPNYCPNCGKKLENQWPDLY